MKQIYPQRNNPNKNLSGGYFLPFLLTALVMLTLSAKVWAQSPTHTFNLTTWSWVGGTAASGTSFTNSGRTLELRNGVNIAVTGTSTGDRNIDIYGSTVRLTLNNASITTTGNYEYTAPPIWISNGCHLILTLVGNNTLTCNSSASTVYEGDNTKLWLNTAGILLNKNSKLTIEGDGMLEVTGKGNWPGIGGNAPNRTIGINSGTVIARGGGDRGAGIGGCGGVGKRVNIFLPASGGTVLINGGTVIAYGGWSGAGIGSGGSSTAIMAGAEGGTILISGNSVVTANGGQDSAGIGGGLRGSGGEVFISGNSVVTAVGVRGAGIGAGASNTINHHLSKDKHGGTTVISGNAVVTAISSGGVAGIGAAPTTPNAGSLIMPSGTPIVFATRMDGYYTDYAPSSDGTPTNITVTQGILVEKDKKTHWHAGNEFNLLRNLTIPYEFTLSIPDNKTFSIPSGSETTLTINGALHIENGALFSNQAYRTVVNNGTINNHNGEIRNNGFLVNNEDAIINNYGVFTNGNATMATDLINKGRINNYHIFKPGSNLSTGDEGIMHAVKFSVIGENGVLTATSEEVDGRISSGSLVPQGCDVLFTATPATDGYGVKEWGNTYHTLNSLEQATLVTVPVPGTDFTYLLSDVRAVHTINAEFRPLCDAITHLAVNYNSDCEAELTWTLHADSYDNNTFNVFRDGTQITSGITSLSYTDTGFDPMVSHIWTVSTVCEEGEYPKTVSKSACSTCNPPTNFSVSWTSDCDAELEWGAPIGDYNSGIYNIYRDGVLIAPNINSTTYTDVGFDPLVSHTWEVKTDCGYGHESSSATVTKTRCFCNDHKIDGTTTYSNVYIPLHTTFPHSYSQQIITKTELNHPPAGSTISSVSIKCDGSTSWLTYNNVKIYLGNTTKDYFSGTTSSDWITPNSLTLVYETSSFTTNPTWITFEFDTPFSYGGDNIVIAMSKSDYTLNANHSWSTHNTSNQMTMRYQNATTSFNINSPQAGTFADIQLRRTDMIFNICTGTPPTPCDPVTDLTVSYTPDCDAELMWAAPVGGGGSETYSIYCDGKPVASDVSSTSYTHTGFDATLAHTWSVRVNCDGGGKSQPTPVSASACILPPPPDCGPPTNLTVNYSSDCQAELIWDTPIGGSGLETYNIYCDGALIASDVASTSYTHTGFNATATHIWSVKISNCDGESLPAIASLPACEPLPPVYNPPANLTVNYSLDCNAALMWDAPEKSITTPKVQNLPPYPPISVAPKVPSGMVNVTLEAHDVWKDGTGFQLLLDNTCTQYGVTIPSLESGIRTFGGTNCAVSPTLYDVFSHKIPFNANPSCTSTNIVFDGSATIQIPAGAYDWGIANPAPADRIWRVGAAGGPATAGVRKNYLFEEGYDYHFLIQYYDVPENDGVTITKTITNPCPAISNLIYNVTDNKLTLSWTAPSGTLPDGYQVLRNGSHAAIVTTTSYTEYINDGLYTYGVEALYSNGCNPVAVYTQEITVGDQCPITLELIGRRSSSWYNVDGHRAAITVLVDGVSYGTYYGPSSVATDAPTIVSHTVHIPAGDVEFVWTQGGYDAEISFNIYDFKNGTLIYNVASGGTLGWTTGSKFFSYESECAPPISYKVYCDGAFIETVDEETFYLHSSFDESTGHTWKVTAICAGSVESASATESLPECTFYCTVEYDGEDIRIPSQLVPRGSLISPIPTVPQKVGYVFEGWFTDNTTFKNRWNFAKNLVTQDTVLWAKWTKIYTVTFAGESISIPSQTVKVGALVAEPKTPQRLHYIFDGWFTDNDTFLNPWNFATDAVTQDTTLWAKWVRTYTVTFAGESISIPSQTVKVGALVTEPKTPQRLHYIFDGWFTDNDTFLNPWNFDTDAVTQDITLYAKWIPVCPTATINYQDVDYKLTPLAGMCWTENLRNRFYATGEAIPFARAYYHVHRPDSTTTAEKFGLLYDWHSAVGTNVTIPLLTGNQGICPEGWHIPTQAEFAQLAQFTANELKSSEFWLTPGSDNHGFSALPAGIYERASLMFVQILGTTGYWSCGYVQESQAHGFFLNYYCSYIQDIITAVTEGLSVRCVKD